MFQLQYQQKVFVLNIRFHQVFFHLCNHEIFSFSIIWFLFIMLFLSLSFFLLNFVATPSMLKCHSWLIPRSAKYKAKYLTYCVISLSLSPFLSLSLFSLFYLKDFLQGLLFFITATDNLIEWASLTNITKHIQIERYMCL